MKIIAIGDTHGQPTWKTIVNIIGDYDHLVFIGDYFDSFTVNTERQMNNLLDIIAYKNSQPEGKVIMLIGNHDHHYFKAVGNCGTSGYQGIGQLNITPVLEANKHHLQMAYKNGNYLFTHAGVSDAFVRDNSIEPDIEHIAERISEWFDTNPLAFTFMNYVGASMYGDDVHQSPIWIRPKSLMKDSKTFKDAGIIQVVGHTHMRTIDYAGKSTGGELYFIDVLSPYNSEHLTIIDGKVIIPKNGETKAVDARVV